jgi:hypothetical protein
MKTVEVVKFREGVFAVRRTRHKASKGSKYSYLHRRFNKWLPVDDLADCCHLHYEDAKKRLDEYNEDTTVDYGTPFSIPPGAE